MQKHKKLFDLNKQGMFKTLYEPRVTDFTN